MVNRAALSVEVTIQDYYFQDDRLDDDQNDDRQDTPVPALLSPDCSKRHAASPISSEQWQHWFGRWLEVLQPDLVEQSQLIGHPELATCQSYELSLRLTDDAEIRAFNAQYRQKDQPTDVLAFAALEVELPEASEVAALESPLYLGDMIISVDTAYAQAEQQHHTLEQELAWLAAHALLHLLGWDHPNEQQLDEMLQRQDFLLQTIGMTSGYHRGESG